MYLRKRTNKFGAKKTLYNGEMYDSKREADYAFELNMRVRAGELRDWKRQVPIDLTVNGVKICTYRIDFLEIAKDDGEMWTEVKGHETPDWKLKWKLFKALYPERKKQVIK